VIALEEAGMNNGIGKKFETVTPYNIDEMAIDDVLKYIPPQYDCRLPAPAAQLNLVKLFYKLLGFDLSPDAALAMTAEPQFQLIIAPAGGGKTTQTQAKIAKRKVIHQLATGNKLYGNRVLCLVYNNHNVKPMAAMQSRIAGKLMASGVEGLDIDREIYPVTLHAFCDRWRSEYANELGMAGFKVLSDNQSVDILRSIWPMVANFMKLENVLPDFNSLFSLYNYSKECMMDYNHPKVRANFPEITLDAEVLDKVFSVYETRKRKSFKFDYIEMLTSAYKLWTTNEQALKRVQTYFDYVVADEVQDFTPLMMSLLKIIVGDNKSLLAIGDEDQCIYTFKGADVDNVLLFSQIFEGGQVYVLNRNRRCRETIVRLASRVINENKSRFGKKITSVKDGGKVELFPYNTPEGQLERLVGIIESMSVEERLDTVICYRDKVYSVLLSEMLEARGIAFNTLSGYSPFSHELYKHVTDVLDLLYDPAEQHSHLCLHKVLPIKSKDLFEILQWSPEKRKFAEEHTRLHFRTVDYGKYDTYAPFSKQMEKLLELSARVGKEPVKCYFPELFEMIKKNFWNYKKEHINNDIDYDNMYTDRVYDFFMSDKTYSELSEELNSRLQTTRRWRQAESGVTLSTFHGLKGLEYKKVFMIYLSASIFPSVEIGIKTGTTEEIERITEVENRLAYVAVTRAIDYLGMFYPVENPSPYVRIAKQFLEEGGQAPVILPKEEQPKKVNLGEVFGGEFNTSNKTEKSDDTDDFGGGSFLSSALGRL
jgi:DNA helicase-2/ATP-dependent DNA helicase PcrA